uniref:ANK_REP_REGION domain-containing protein n=1 Tax=Parastrongyloides trichosuri TaxID=131310 RepID=A0A0N4Z5Q4_PARTI
MSKCEEDIQKLIDESNSLTEICDIIHKNGSDSANYFQIHKRYNPGSYIFKVKAENLKDPANTGILLSTFFGSYVSSEKVQEDLSKVPPITKELKKILILEIHDDTREMSKEDKNLLAQKYATFIDFFFNENPNCLSLMLSNKCQILSDFSIYIIKNIKTDKIESIDIDDIFQIINFTKENDLINNDIFMNMTNLKCFYCSINKFGNFKEIEEFENELNLFLEFMKKHKDINFLFGVRSLKKQMNLACKIVEYGHENGLKISMKHLSIFPDIYFSDNIEKKCVALKLRRNLCLAKINIEELKDLDKLKLVLSTFVNLKTISVEFESDFITKSLKEFKDEIKLLEALKNAFNFTTTIENLKKIKISFWQNMERDQNCNIINEKLYDTIFKMILSVFPDTINAIQFNSPNIISESIWNMIASKYTQLEEINLFDVSNIYKNAFSEIKSLKYVVMEMETKVNIPEWVQIVIIKYVIINPHNPVSRDFDIEYYFELFNTTFNCSLKDVFKDDTRQIALLRNIFDWKNVLAL